MIVRSIHVYVAATVAVSLAVLITADWTVVSSLPRAAIVGLVALTLLGLFSELAAFSYDLGSTGGSSSLVFLPLVAAVMLFGPAPALAFILLTAAIAEFLIRKKSFIRALFNTAQYVNATAVAGYLFTATGGYALAATVPPVSDFDAQVISVLVFGVSALLLNHLAVAVAIALSQARDIWTVLRTIFNRIGGTVLNDMLVLPVAILVAFLYFELQVTGLLVSLLPLIFIRYSYLAKFRLEQANRDLLHVLVKAIETRDPYTSGHSLRVQALARKIAEQIGLSLRQEAELETAALLHDIGKIEVVYEEILRKPSALSEEERRTIESHVDRGVEILTSLSSFNSRVIAAIRHHHELYDGTGYPDGLAGERIPLYARIIKISDAIDAMLSSRPYRRALSEAEARSELRTYSGKHFDPVLVDAVLGSPVLSAHISDIAIATSLHADHKRGAMGGEEMLPHPMEGARRSFNT